MPPLASIQSRFSSCQRFSHTLSFAQYVLPKSVFAELYDGLHRSDHRLEIWRVILLGTPC